MKQGIKMREKRGVMGGWGGGERTELVFHVYRVRSHNDAYLSLQGFKDSSTRKHVVSAHILWRRQGIKRKITKSRRNRYCVFVVRRIEFYYSDCMLSEFWMKE